MAAFMAHASTQRSLRLRCVTSPPRADCRLRRESMVASDFYLSVRGILPRLIAAPMPKRHNLNVLPPTRGPSNGGRNRFRTSALGADVWHCFAQLLGRAFGGRRSSWSLAARRHQPVQDAANGKVEITSTTMARGRSDSLPRSEVTHLNLTIAASKACAIRRCPYSQCNISRSRTRPSRCRAPFQRLLN